MSFRFSPPDLSRSRVRAYRSRFDRWGVHKYNRRQHGGGSTSNGSQEGSPRTDDDDDSRFSVRSEGHDSPLVAATPPSSPQSDQTTPLAGEQGRSHQPALQPLAVMSPHQRYFPESSGIFGGGGGGSLVPPSPSSAESTSSGSTMSRNSSISQPYNDPHGSSHHRRQSRAGMDYSSTSPTEHQYRPFDVYQQHHYQQHYQSRHQYHPQPHGSGPGRGLALPPAMGTQHDQGGGAYMWPVSPLQPPFQVSGADIKAPRD